MVSKGDAPDPVLSGGNLSYTIETRNDGPDAALDVVMTDNLPGGVELVSTTASAGSCDLRPRKVTCTAAGLDPGTALTVSILVRVVRQREGRIVNAASARSDIPDPRAGNDSDTEGTRVEEAPPVICKGRQATIVGTEGDDALTATQANDVVAALGGNDSVQALGGADVLCGGNGADNFRGQGEADLIRGGFGDDVVRGGGGADNVGGGQGRDRVSGGLRADLLNGGPGRDRCNGGSGHDVKRSC